MYLIASKKNELYRCKPPDWNHAVPLSQDWSATTGAKRYLWLQDHHSVIRLLKRIEEPHFYEIIDGKCMMYFDVEWYDDDGDYPNEIAVLQDIIKHFEAFLEKYYHSGGDWKITRSSSEKKRSFHLIYRGDWYLLGTTEGRHIYDSFVEFCLRSGASFLNCLRDKDGYLEHIPMDNTVYGSWQNMRTIASSKKGKNIPLLPIKGSGEPIIRLSDEEWLLYFTTFITPGTVPLDVSRFPISNWGRNEINKRKPKKKKSKKGKNKKGKDEKGKAENQEEDEENQDEEGEEGEGEEEEEEDEDEDEKDEEVIGHYCERRGEVYRDLLLPKSKIIPSENDDSIGFYLSCIPNSGERQEQPWNVYLGIMMAVWREKAPYEVFQKWAFKSKKFNDKTSRTSWESFSRNPREIGYNKGTLRNLAKMCCPHAFPIVVPRPDLLKLPDIVNVEIYNERYVRPLPIEQAKTILLRSGMGTGKTSTLIKKIKSELPERVIVVSPRQTFASNITAELNKNLEGTGIQFKSYLDPTIQSGQLSNVNYLVIQMESLWKLENGFRPYDILVMDECESCLKQFSSPTMIQKPGVLKGNLERMERIYITAGLRYLLDAFLWQKTIDFVECLSKETEKITYILNEHIRERRNAYRHFNVQSFYRDLFQAIQDNKKVIVFWASLKKGLAIEEALREAFPSLRIKFYHGQADDAMNKDLADVRNCWKNVDVLMFTPKITVGVNFDEENVFDTLFMYGCASSCCVRDAMQASMRVRHIKTKTLHFYLDNKIVGRNIKVIPTTLAGVENDIKNKVANLTEFANDPEIKGYVALKQINDETGWMRKVYLHNLLEDNLSKVNHAEVFQEFLKMCGYSISECGENPEFLDLQGLGERPDYDSIDEYGIDDVLERIENGDASMDDKWRAKKYWFKYNFKIFTDPMILKGIWEEYWENRAHQERIKRLRLEKKETGLLDIFTHDQIKAPLYEFMSDECVRFKNLKQMLDILGLSNSMDSSKIITWQEMENIVPQILKMKEKLQEVFRLRDKGTGKISELRQAVELVNKILADWSGSKLKKQKRKKIKVDGKQKEVYDYILSNEYDVYVKEIGQTSIYDILKD